jgi:hypothetical protein
MTVRTKHLNKRKSQGRGKGLLEETHRKGEILAALNHLNTHPTEKHSKPPIHKTMIGVMTSIVRTERPGITS